ncbi:MAG TPA: EpsI family protein [Myxococcota bacterium]|nr:EpsI family protein [Myxococcota bacterium]
MSERLATALALLLLLVAGGVAWALQLRARLEPQAESLRSIPFEISSFVGVDTPIGDNVEEMLSADFNIQREYLHPLGQLVWVYIGYYGTERGGTPEHTPRACYLAHGWRVVDEQPVVTDAETGTRAMEYLVESGGNQQLVMFWYRSHRATGMLSTLRLQLDHVAGRLTNGRGDGALVRLSTPLVGFDRDAARGLLVSFAKLIEPKLADAWPTERSAEASPVERLGARLAPR